MSKIHQPVMPREVIEYLDLKENGTYLDLTVGAGGHSCELLREMQGKIHLIGFDRDMSILEFADKNLAQFNGCYSLHHSSFCDVAKVLHEQKITEINGVLMDVGVSSLQLDLGDRGFSLQKEGPLDMRMDTSQNFSAEDVVNGYSEKDLADIIFHYGEERKSRQIASAIVDYRRRKKILSTLELANLITNTLRYRGKIHPATKTFQAIRIEVNQELQQLQHTLEVLPEILAPQGRAVVISFHSLEDRIVKNAFKSNDLWKAITKKPITASQEEVKKNRRSRSAKLRCAIQQSHGV